MGAQRKLKKLKVANDLPKQVASQRTTIITFSTPTPKTLHRLTAAGVLAFFLGLTGTMVFTSNQPSPSQPIKASQPQILPTALPRTIQVPASHLVPNPSAFDEQTVNIVASKIGELPALRAQRTPHVVSEDEGGPADRLTEASAYLQSGDWDAALQIYDEILSYEPHSHDALSGKIYVQSKLGDINGAIATGQMLVKIYSSDTGAKVNLAHLLTRSGNMDEAILMLDAAARSKPGYLPYRLELASLYDRTKHATEALMLYRQILAGAESEESTNLPIARIQDRIDYLESARADTAADPSTTRPVDN